MCAIVLAGCKLDGQPDVSVAQPRGASFAFESIDGPPPAQLQTLVENLNNEAQTRRLAVVSRDHQSAYRVRDYLAAEMDKGKTTFPGYGTCSMQTRGAPCASAALKPSRASSRAGRPPTKPCCNGSPKPA